MNKESVLINNLNKWKNSRDTVKINTSHIVVTDDIHLQTNIINFNGNINSLSYYNNKATPIVLRKLKNNKHQLLFGLNQLIKAKLLNKKTISAIVVSCDREYLVNYLNNVYRNKDNELIDIKSIKITGEFKNTIPRNDKVITKIKLMSEGIIDIVKVDKNNVLKDGYITYLLLKNEGYNYIKVKYM